MLQILNAANQVLPAFLGDKGYDAMAIYNTMICGGEAFIPLNKHNTKDPSKLPQRNLICDASLAMHKDGKTFDGHGACGRIIAVHSASLSPMSALVIIHTRTTAKKLGLHQV